MTLTVDRLREALSYNADTGVFTRLEDRPNSRAGTVAGTVRPDGYLDIRIDWKRHKAHRLAWLYVHGNWPLDQLDHINGDKADNRISNLRECSAAENNQNLGLKKSNKTGFVGVCWVPRCNKFQANLGVGGKTLNLGRFDSAGAAHAAYVEAKAKHHAFSPAVRSR